MRLSRSLATAELVSSASSASHSARRVGEQKCLELLQACDSFSKVAQIHAHLTKAGLQSNPFVLTKFSATCSSLDAVDYAASLAFSRLSKPSPLYDTFLFNTLIRGYADSSHSKIKAFSIFSLMLCYAITPNKFTFPFLLKACARLEDLLIGKQIHGFIIKLGFETDLYVQNTLVHMYASCTNGGLEFAREVFDEMPKMDPVCWSAMIGGYVRAGQSSDAVTLFRMMQSEQVVPDEVTMVTVLSACADLGALELGKWIGTYIEREGIAKTVPLCNALIDMYAKCGSIDNAVRVFALMPERSIVSWTSMIDGLAMHGRGSEAIMLFDKMKGEGFIPDDVAFIGVLSACSHAGMVESGCNYFNSMKSDFAIIPKIEHYGCMVDLFGRAGLVKRALEFVKDMPMEPNPVIWRTLLSACRVHGEFEIGEGITKQLIREETMHGSDYVLLSNVYASMCRWDKKSKIRHMMDKKGIKKVPGCSLIELDNEIYEFVAGDKSHPQYKEIYEMVEEMGKELRSAGYAPTTSEVLLDIDEEDKEDALYWHSEKLAIAFALLNTKPGTPIRIVKNLRVCTDCHSATKFISKVYDREIVVRDRNRFHQFKDGLCTCKDYW